MLTAKKKKKIIKNYSLNCGSVYTEYECFELRE